ncbi:MAG: hypothetical protein NC406_00885 [Bacteroides sp.]|nr:hypothetical protein [Bacteroides sp.]
MKKYTNILLGLAGALAFTACSSADDAPEMAPATGDVTVSVVTGDALTSRALGTVEGYKLQCVMQLLDKDGKTVGTQAIEDAAAGTARFTIKRADINAGATNAAFWAEYVPTAGGAKVYDSSDLTKIGYQTTAFDLADANLMKAADAFAGKLTSIEANNTVTLARPVSQVNFTPENPAVVAGATKLVVKYDATSAYNVATSNCATDAAGYQALTLTNASFDATATPWFSTFIIMPANLAKYDKAIDMTVTTAAGDRNFQIKANEIPADPNYIVNVKGELSEQQDAVVDVTINGDYINEPEPEKPAEFKVGAFVKADGTATANKADAVAVVFATEAIGADVPANYPAAFQGKTIKGYAIALENTTAAPKNLCAAAGTLTGLTENKDITNGTQYTADLFTAFGSSSPLVEAYNTWVAAHALTGANVTEWYVGTAVQLEVWGQLIAATTLFTDGSKTVGPTGTPEFIALFPKESLVDGTKTNRKYLSCSINNGGRPSGIDINVSATPYVAKFSQFGSDTNPAFVRPMMTIFE